MKRLAKALLWATRIDRLKIEMESVGSEAQEKLDEAIAALESKTEEVIPWSRRCWGNGQGRACKLAYGHEGPCMSPEFKWRGSP